MEIGAKLTRKAQAENTRRKICKVAEEIFKTKSYEEVSVDQIVKESGVSKGTFYVHFTSKDSLIAELITNYVNSVDTDYQAHLDTLPKNFNATKRLLSLIEKITDILINQIGYNRMIAVYKVQFAKQVDTQNLQGYQRELYNIFSSELEKGFKSGEFKSDLPLDVLTKHFVMSIRGISQEWCIRYPDFNYKEVALEHFKILLSGITK